LGTRKLRIFEGFQKSAEAADWALVGSYRRLSCGADGYFAGRSTLRAATVRERDMTREEQIGVLLSLA
jgi:hypothetical protein